MSTHVCRREGGKKKVRNSVYIECEQPLFKNMYYWKLQVYGECATIPSWILNEGNTKVVGGNDAHAPIPWQVFLTAVFMTSRGSRRYMCGGTIIDEETILTAAHCIKMSGDARVDLDETYIIAGSINRNGDGNEQKVVGLKKIISHPDYNSDNQDNDIAILKLLTEKRLQFNAYVKPACIPDPSFRPKVSQSIAYASGWGKTEGNASTKLFFLHFLSFIVAEHFLFERG